MDRLVDNPFDIYGNAFSDTRRVADIWEWGNTVFWPGLFSDAGPCDTSTVGSLSLGASGSGKPCRDQVWPDGDGPFHLDGATPLSVSNLVEMMDQMDWTDGVSIRQSRAAPSVCEQTEQLGACLPELDGGVTPARESFGYNHSHPGESLSHPFVYLAPGELGANPSGLLSASVPSMRTYESGGYLAFVVPFFSDTWLPEEEGSTDEVRDYRLSYVNVSNGKVAKYWCVRSSLNGMHLRQLCDPGEEGNGKGALTGAVRAHVEDFWNELKRRHFIDTRTRAVTIVLQLKSNHLGVRYRISLMYELTSLGAILPSYDVETRVIDRELASARSSYAAIGLAMNCFFVLLEGIELAKRGAVEYFSDVWNVMDWANFLLYFLVFGELGAVAHTAAHPDCSSYLCAEAGYFDDWRLMAEFSQAKLYLSLCVCIQMLKLLKFASELVPKMGLATNVLRHCAIDLLFFGVAFAISMMSFAMMLYVQLGHVMANFVNPQTSFISLFRALFGDFDIDAIMNNSSGFLNVILFLVYLFVAIFIMLSMFLAILAEAQVNVRAHEAEIKKDESYREFGVISQSIDKARSLRRALARGPRRKRLPARPDGAHPASRVPPIAGLADPAGSITVEETLQIILGEMRRMHAQVGLLRAQVTSRYDAPAVARTYAGTPKSPWPFGGAYALGLGGSRGAWSGDGNDEDTFIRSPHPVERMPPWSQNSGLATPAPPPVASPDRAQQGIPRRRTPLQPPSRPAPSVASVTTDSQQNAAGAAGGLSRDGLATCCPSPSPAPCRDHAPAANAVSQPRATHAQNAPGPVRRPRAKHWQNV
jgi:hypothetical protein